MLVRTLLLVRLLVCQYVYIWFYSKIRAGFCSMSGMGVPPNPSLLCTEAWPWQILTVWENNYGADVSYAMPLGLCKNTDIMCINYSIYIYSWWGFWKHLALNWVGIDSFICACLENLLIILHALCSMQRINNCESINAESAKPRVCGWCVKDSIPFPFWCFAVDAVGLHGKLHCLWGGLSCFIQVNRGRGSSTGR